MTLVIHWELCGKLDFKREDKCYKNEPQPVYQSCTVSYYRTSKYTLTKRTKDKKPECLLGKARIIHSIRHLKTQGTGDLISGNTPAKQVRGCAQWDKSCSLEKSASRLGILY